MEMKFFILLVLLMVLAEDSGVHGSVVTIAKGYIGSTNWAQASNMLICEISYQGQYKGHIFVADVFGEAGVSVPDIDTSCYKPIGSEEWANPASEYLTDSPCWTQLTDVPDVTELENGVVAAFDGQVGIVTGYQLTTSVAPDQVVENDWGFRTDQDTVFWSYSC